MLGDVEQKSADLKNTDRNYIWIKLTEGEMNPQSARYDLSAGLNSNGPWKLLTRSVIEDAPSSDNWAWNGLDGEEWLNVRMSGNTYVPYGVKVDTIKGKLVFEQFAGDGSKARFYIRARSKDCAGNEYTTVKAIDLDIDRRAPKLQLDEVSFKIIDYDRAGGAITGKVTDEPAEDIPLTGELQKDGRTVSKYVLSGKYGGEFMLTIPQDATWIENGTHNMNVVATDVDGNNTSVPVQVELDIKPLSVEIENTVYVKTGVGSDLGKTVMDLDIGIVPNSQVSLKVDGKKVMNKVNVGATQRLKKSVEITFKLKSGEHQGVLQIYKDGKSVSKYFTLLVDNDKPTIKSVILEDSGKTLYSVNESMMNVLKSPMSDLKLRLPTKLPYII